MENDIELKEGANYLPNSIKIGVSFHKNKEVHAGVTNGHIDKKNEAWVKEGKTVTIAGI